ncbi:MAG: TolC family protein [Vicinamibacterales bacterium]
MMRRLGAALTLLCAAAAPVALLAQGPAPAPPPSGASPGASTGQPAGPAATPRVFTLDEALAHAVEHYPSVRAALEQVTASTAGVDVARAAYLPRLESLWQTNRATVNNITGLLLPQSVAPGISGPPLASTSGRSVWGSVAGAFFSWEPFDFGLREAGVRGAEAAVARARADQSLTQLEVQNAVGSAYLAVVHAGQALAAARADVERRTVLARAARTLADAQLRPGAEASRADAERAAAETRAILARRTLIVSQTALARLLGVADGQVGVSATGLLAPPAASTSTSGRPSEHPLARTRLASVDAARIQEDALARVFRPKLFLQSTLYARGSGAEYNGALEGGAAGLGLERTNWATGVQVVFPNLFELASLRARRAAASATTRAERARYDEALLAVSHQQREAAAILEAARAVAANTPVQLEAARQSESQARARYDAGLASIVEVADAQNLLAQAEYQDAAARVDVWRALLADAVARGDFAPLFDRIRSAGGGR